MRRVFSALLMTATMAAPMMVPAQALANGSGVSATVTFRVYDPYRHDYHPWGPHEEHRYRVYLAERHRAYLAYERQRVADRRAYWRWRHEREEHERHW